MASLWDVVTGKSRTNASAEQLKREAEAEAKRKAEEAAQEKADAESKDAQKKVDSIRFKAGGTVRGWGAAKGAKKANIR